MRLDVGPFFGAALAIATQRCKVRVLASTRGSNSRVSSSSTASSSSSPAMGSRAADVAQTVRAVDAASQDVDHGRTPETLEKDHRKATSDTMR